MHGCHNNLVIFVWDVSCMHLRLSGCGATPAGGLEMGGRPIARGAASTAASGGPAAAYYNH